MNRIRTRRGLFARALEYVFYKLETSWYAVACCYAVVIVLVIAINLGRNV